MNGVFNKKIQNLISESLCQLKRVLNNEMFEIVRTEFNKIHNCEVGTSESFFNLRKNNTIPDETLYEIEASFYNIGNHIAIPTRGSTNLLREVYKEDVGENLETDFLSYQFNIIDYVHQEVNKIL
jgi:hypothetical protein